MVGVEIRGGTRRRERRVWRDARAEGKECQGESIEVETCNARRCPEDQGEVFNNNSNIDVIN